MRIRGYKVGLTARSASSSSSSICWLPARAAHRSLRPVDAGWRRWADPDPQHWLGLDNLGRDILSRLIYGARMSIGLSLVITALSFLIGVITGFAAAVPAAGSTGAVAPRRPPAVDSDADLRLRRPLGARLLDAGAGLHHRHPRFHQGLSAGARSASISSAWSSSRWRACAAKGCGGSSRARFCPMRFRR